MINDNKTNIYISYFHVDEYFKDLLNDIIGYRHNINSSPQEYYIKSNFNNYINKLDKNSNDKSIFIVLVGTDTYKSINVDWELQFSLKNHYSIMGLCLPTNDDYKKDYYNPKNLPVKLADNINSGYASYFDWTDNSNDLENYIDITLNKRNYGYALI